MKGDEPCRPRTGADEADATQAQNLHVDRAWDIPTQGARPVFGGAAETVAAHHRAVESRARRTAYDEVVTSRGPPRTPHAAASRRP